jgi:hypothetical protein
MDTSAIDRLVPTDLWGTLEAILATGAPRFEAIGLVAQAHGTEAAHALWARLGAVLHHQSATTEALWAVATHAPDAANAWLGEWLLHRQCLGPYPLDEDLNLDGQSWVTTLPQGYRHPYGVSLGGTSVTALPEGFQVGHILRLTKTPIATLPDGLGIGQDLFLWGCNHWDGRIPADATVGGDVYTPKYPNGLPLASWRTLHPMGEQP